MNYVCKEIFKAIHEGKWLTVEYKNKDDKVTKYWVGIKDINLFKRSLIVEGLHLVNLSICELTIFIDSIVSANVINGTYFPRNDYLIKDISENQKKYSTVFENIINLKILNYLSDCNKMDTTPYWSNYMLLNNFDNDCIKNGSYKLSDEQFRNIVAEFQASSTREKSSYKVKDICINVLSISTKKGLYVLAYKALYLDVANRVLKPAEEVTICKEFTIDGERQSVRNFLDADDCSLLDEFNSNLELIKDRIQQQNRSVFVDDRPYIMAIERNIIIDLDSEYSAIIDMHESEGMTDPLKAFFGSLVARPNRKRDRPLALINKKVNLDQLLAINNALKFPIAYIQGPPGTGKTNTIINTISTAFFNDRKVLFSSYNNHPIDGVFKALTNLKYKGNNIYFPIIRLGNNEKIREAIIYIRDLFENVQQIKVFDNALERIKEKKIESTNKLSELLKKYDKILDLRDRKDALQKIISSTTDLTFLADLQSRQIVEIERQLEELGKVTDEEALALLPDDFDEYYKFLNYTSAKHIKKIGTPKYKDLKDILYLDDEEQQLVEFNRYIADDEKFEKFLDIFPIVVTTCISAHRLGNPKQYFDMVILDEASQCNTAMSLVPILRGKNLMLVGDPQQLNPVILLDANTNNLLKNKYHIAPEYDYISNSIYKTYLACDSVSDEVLLSHHYRCNRKIIEFNNKKYYNGKLQIHNSSTDEEPLVFVDVQNNTTNYKNTAPEECEQIIKFLKNHRDKDIGIITPFINQKNLINEVIKEEGIPAVTCGTVHAFQGDEKDIILFSLALTDKTYQKTYDWLKGNKELINVAVSRAKDKLILLTNNSELERLHSTNPENDDIYELAQYIKTNGESRVTSRQSNSRALGIKPYSTEIESEFLTTLDHAINNIRLGHRRCEVKKEVPISQVFSQDFSHTDLFYRGRFDFVIYDKRSRMPIFAIELDGKEHFDDDTVKLRDAKKKKICREHNFELIRVENSYARRYAYIKDILTDYFKKL